MDGGSEGALVLGILWSFIIFFIGIAIVVKLLVGILGGRECCSPLFRY